MPLNKDILGQALYDALNTFNNKNPDEFGNMETQRLAFCKVIANEVIEHFKANGVITLNPLGLTAGIEPVVGVAQSILT